jgi:hypothetical protein
MRADQRPRSASHDSRWNSGANLLGLVVCCVLSLCCFLLSSRAESVGRQDFRGLYAAGQMVLHCPSLLFNQSVQAQWQHAAAGGSQLVTFEHPAYEALLYAPLSIFSYRTAYLVYAGCNMLLLWLCSLFAPPAVSEFACCYRPAFFFLSFPLLLTIFVGQNSILFLLAVCLAYNALAAGKDRLAGLILGLVIFKLAIAVPLAILISIRRGRNFVLGFAGASGALAALSIWIAGLRGTRDFLHLLASATLSTDHSIKAQFDYGIWLHAMPNLPGLFYLLGSGHLSPRGFNTLNLAGTFALFCACAWLQRHIVAESTAFASAVLCAVLASPHLYIYELAVLPVAFLLLSSPWLKAIAILWFLLPPLLYAISFPYLMWFAPGVIVPLLLLAVCFRALKQREPNSTRPHLDCSPVAQ